MLANCRGSNSENWRRMEGPREGPQYRRSAIRSTSLPGFSPLPREITLVAAGHVAHKMWEPTRIYLMRGLVKYKIVAVARKDTKYNGELAT